MAFGADRTIYLPCVMKPPLNERWMLINLQKRVIGLFEQDLEETFVRGDYEWADTQIQVLANRAFAMGNIMFDVQRVPQEWVVTLKSQLWPSNTGWLSQSSRFSSELLPRHRPELKILRPPRPPRTEPDLFRVKNVPIPYQRKKFVDRQNFDD